MTDIKTDYVTTAQAAEILSQRYGEYSASTVQRLCRLGRIEGAFLVGKTWLLPRQWAETHIKTRGPLRLAPEKYQIYTLRHCQQGWGIAVANYLKGSDSFDFWTSLGGHWTSQGTSEESFAYCVRKWFKNKESAYKALRTWIYRQEYHLRDWADTVPHVQMYWDEADRSLDWVKDILATQKEPPLDL